MNYDKMSIRLVIFLVLPDIFVHQARVSFLPLFISLDDNEEANDIEARK